jgi:hypothetical protein
VRGSFVSAVNIDDFVAVLSQHACPICVVCSARLGGEVLPGVHSALQDAVEQPGLGSTSRHPKKVLPPRRPTDQHHAISTSATRDALRRVPLARALQSCAAAAAIPPMPSLLSGSRLGNLARPVMRTAAGLHADATRASLAKNANTSLRFWWVMKARGTRPATVARGSGRRCPASRDRRSRLRLRPSRM